MSPKLSNLQFEVALLQTNVWQPILDSLQKVGLALIPLGLAVVLILKFAFSDNEGLQSESGSRLRTVGAGALLILLAYPMFAMMTGWLPGASALPGGDLASISSQEPKDPSEMNCEELIEHYRPQNEKEDIKQARENPQEGMTPEESAENVRNIWDSYNKKRCGTSPGSGGEGKWVENDRER